MVTTKNPRVNGKEMMQLVTFTFVYRIPLFFFPSLSLLGSTVIKCDTTVDLLLLQFMFMNINFCLKLRYMLNNKITMHNPIYVIKVDIFPLRKSSSYIK